VVAVNRRLRILSLLGGEEHPGAETKRLCEVCAEVTGATGAGIMLMDGDVSRGSVCTTNDVSARIEQLQYDLGEGPCIDAYNADQPIDEPDLAHPETPRWLAFSGPAIAAGVGSIFGYPLRVGAVRLGALNLYRDRPGPLGVEEHADALVMADIAAQAVLLLQAGAPAGSVAAEIEAGAEFQYVVHQAAGMVAVQLDITVGQALIRLRAHAYRVGRPLTEIARDVVARTMHFDASSGEPDRWV
jgi:hypothetical protein